jgi:hypothetical protein
MAFNTPYTTGASVQTPFNQGPAPAPQQAGPVKPQATPTQAPQLDPSSIPLDVLVTHDYVTGKPDREILANLMQTKEAGQQVRDELSKGTDPSAIVAKFGGKPLASFKASDPAEKVKAQSFLTNLMQGGQKGVADMGLAAGQMAASLPTSVSAGFEGAPQDMGDNSKVPQQLMDVQKAREADPALQALMKTGGGKVGDIGVKALPYIGAGALAPEGVLPAIAAQGAAGAASGALTPTTQAGDRLKNVAVDAAIGAGTQGAFSGLGKLVSMGKSGVSKALTNPELAQQMAGAGLTPTRGTTNPLVKALANKFAEAKDAINEGAKADLTKTAIQSLPGHNGATELSPDVLQNLKRGVWGDTNAAVKNVQIPSTPTFDATLDSIGTTYGHDALSTLSDGKVQGIINDIKLKAANGQLTGPRALDYLRDTRDLAGNSENSADRTAFKAISSTLKDSISTAAPDAAALLEKSNQLHPKLLVLQDAFKRSNEAPVLTPQQFATSNKKFINDSTNTTPFADLNKASQAAYVAPAGSTSRYAGPIAALIQHGPAAAGAVLGLMHGGLGEGAGSMIAGEVGQKMLGKLLARAANKPVSGVSKANTNNKVQQKLAALLQSGAVARFLVMDPPGFG